MDSKLVLIGIIESQENKNTLEFIKELLIELNYQIIYSNSKKSVIFLKGEDNGLVLMDINPKETQVYESVGIEFHILIHNFIKSKDYERDLLSEKLTNCQYYILNSDDENWTSLPLGLLNGVVITYGFNSKSTLTISSYDINQSLVANIYLQREILSLSGKRIEPFEFSVKIDSKNKDNIYSVLAATALALILGHKNPYIKL